MGWNAGGFGRMSFPSVAQAQQWLAARRSHGDWNDWVGELELGEDEPFVVAELLDQFADWHDPADHGIYAIELNDAELDLVFDVGEDDFRDNAATLAALLRSADACDATGKFWFLGTAGAEYDFAYQLTVGDGRSEIKVLGGRQLARIYEGPEYREFSKQVAGLIEDADPAFKKLMTELREGRPGGLASQALHDRVMTALAACSDQSIAAAAARYPEFIPDGHGLVEPKKYFAKGARDKLAGATSEQLYGVALWALGEIDADAAGPLAHQALAAQQTPTVVKSAAMAALAHRPSPQTVEQMLIALDGEDFMLRYGALRALRILPADYHPQLAPQVTSRLAVLATGDAPAPAGMAGGPSIVDVVKDHNLRETLPALAAFACSQQPVDARDAAAELIIEWNDRGSLAAIATRIGEEFGIGVTAARALIIFDPQAALTELIATATSTAGGQDEADRRLHHLLKALIADAAKAGKQSLIQRDERWTVPVLGLLDLGDNYLAHNALSLLEHSPRDPQVIQRLEELLRTGSMPPIPVTQALRALRSKNYKAIIKQRLTVTTDKREIEQLRLCL
jgi:hypothetical protein